MTYPPEQYEFLGVFSSICFDSVGCFELPVAGEGAVPLSTGHTLSMAPLTIAGWKGIPCASDGECAKECNQGTCSNTGGFGGLILVHVSAPDTPLNPSFLLPSGAVFGDPLVATLRFQPKPDAQPFSLDLDDLLGSGPGGEGLGDSGSPFSPCHPAPRP